eukprot:jgi/Galph1/19/GphlegSOOS_G4862.1
MVQFHLQVLGSGHENIGPSILLFFDDKRYLFNCGEGIQRLCSEYSVNLFRVDSIFFTNLSASYAGGLFGLLLTLADAGKNSVNLYGPKGLEQLLEAASSFYKRPSLTLGVMEIEGIINNVYHDSNLTIDAITMRLPQLIREEKVETVALKRRRFISRAPCVSYVVTMVDIPGKFDPQAAASLKVPKGRLFGQLSRGETVTLPDGVIIQPSQVMSLPTPGPAVVIICCPHIEYVPLIVSTARLGRNSLRLPSHEGYSTTERHLCVIHIGTFAVFLDDQYSKWVGSLGDDVTHMLFAQDSEEAPLVFLSQKQFLSFLADTVDSTIFHVPQDTCFADGNMSMQSIGDKIQEKWNNSHLFFSKSLMKYHLAPLSKVGIEEYKLAWDKNSFPETSGDTDKEKSLSWKMNTTTVDSSPSFAADVGEIIFLGTGAAIPSKLRNVSSIYIHLFNRGGVMLDCGEGTFGQLIQIFGIKEIEQVIKQIKLIFLSHMHADHHLGILRILEYRSKFSVEQPLVIMGPLELDEWLKAYQLINEPLQYIFLDNENFVHPQQPIVHYISSTVGLEVTTVPVMHCFHAYGIIIKDSLHDWKLVYSGDTLPWEPLIHAGKYATVVIHEATFESGMEDFAKGKAHCTFGQALQVCKAMNAFRIFLTHFSQRYTKFPQVDNVRDPQLMVAFDLMRVNFQYLSQVPRLLPVLCDIFEGNHSETETAALGDEIQPLHSFES